VTAKVVKYNVNKLIEYGCGKCGASPIDGNDVAKGQIKVDFTRGACETGICDTTRVKASGSLHRSAGTGVFPTTGIVPRTESVTKDDASVFAASDETNSYEVALEEASALLHNSCRGSSNCNGVCDRNIEEVKRYVDHISKS
jgi:hypothetical protein